MSDYEPKYHADNYRWIGLILFCCLSICNSFFWVTFAPISDLTQEYIGGDGSYNNITAINMLANIYLVFYLPGTIFTNILRKQYGLRKTFLICGILTFLGALSRFIPTLFYLHLSSGWIYMSLFMGQFIAAIVQPFFCNIPPGFSNVWFPASERDIATAIGSVATTTGNAMGLLLSVYFVSHDSSSSIATSTSVSASTSIAHGMSRLLGTETIIIGVILVLFYFFFRSAPLHPPSAAAAAKNRLIAGDNKYNNYSSTAFIISDDGKKGRVLELPMISKSTSILSSDDVFIETGNQDAVPLPPKTQIIMKSKLHSSIELFVSEISELLQNRNYVLLLCIYMVSNGLLCALQILLYQLIQPFNYTNHDAGVLGSVLIASGVCGAAVASVIMTCLKNYNSIFKLFQTCAMCCITFFVLMIRRNNYDSLLLSIVLLGSFLNPLTLINMELCAEITFPIAEDVSFGLLAIGGNIVGFLLVLIMQQLERFESIHITIDIPSFLSWMISKSTTSTEQQNDSVSFSIPPSSLFIVGIFLIITVLSHFFKGVYKRSQVTSDANFMTLSTSSSSSSSSDTHTTYSYTPVSNSINSNSSYQDYNRSPHHQHHQHYNFNPSFTPVVNVSSDVDQ